MEREKQNIFSPWLYEQKKMFYIVIFLSIVDLRCFEMEKEKESVSSPRGVIEAFIRGAENEPSSPESNTSEAAELCSSKSWGLSRWHNFFKLWKRKSIKRFPSFPPLSVPKISRRKSRSVRENTDIDLSHFKSSWKNFTLSDLITATNNFSRGLLCSFSSRFKKYIFSLLLCKFC